MNLSPEILAEIFRQSAFISALIAGFSFAFLAVILTNPNKSHIDNWIAGFAIAATAGLVVCALGWTFGIPQVLALSSNTAGTAGYQIPEYLRVIHRSLSLTFLACFCFFLTSLGLSGWLRSRTLGIVSSTIAVIAACFAIWIIKYFIQ